MALSRCRLGESLPSVDDCPRTAPPIPDQGWLVCLGMGGWFPSESPAGLRRNGRLLSVGIRSKVGHGRVLWGHHTTDTLGSNEGNPAGHRVHLLDPHPRTHSLTDGA